MESLLAGYTKQGPLHRGVEWDFEGVRTWGGKVVAPKAAQLRLVWGYARHKISKFRAWGSLRWSRHLWFYDRGRLGRVEIVTLIPAPSPLPLTRPISSSLREFQHGAFAIKTIRARPMKTPALQATAFCSYQLVKWGTLKKNRLARH